MIKFATFCCRFLLSAETEPYFLPVTERGIALQDAPIVLLIVFLSSQKNSLHNGNGISGCSECGPSCTNSCKASKLDWCHLDNRLVQLNKRTGVMLNLLVSPTKETPFGPQIVKVSRQSLRVSSPCRMWSFGSLGGLMRRMKAHLFSTPVYKDQQQEKAAHWSIISK